MVYCNWPLYYDFEKFSAFAETLSRLVGNPLYHWAHLELQRYFGINIPLTAETAREIYDACNKVLLRQEMSARGIMRASNVEVVCTTDDPCDSLQHHAAIRQSGFEVKVLPTFRPDRALDMERDDFCEYITQLGHVCNAKLECTEDVLSALSARIDYFEKMGCKLSDHAFERLPGLSCTREEADALLKTRLGGTKLEEAQVLKYKSYMIRALGAEIARRGWTMQLHIGAMRNNNSRMFERLGRDTGFDTMADHDLARSLSSLLDSLESRDSLPKTIIYTLNPKDNYVIAALTGAFGGEGIAAKVQFGSAWWFVDHRDGMTQQMKDLGNLGYLAGFIGMLTDSRSFLSYTRHEYFRRILCAILGGFVEDGEYPDDDKMLTKITEDICHHNAARFLNL